MLINKNIVNKQEFCLKIQYFIVIFNRRNLDILNQNMQNFLKKLPTKCHLYLGYQNDRLDLKNLVEI
jgi:hypothetical protein